MSEKRIAAAKNMVVRQRNYRRARDRALVRLAQAHPDTYKELLEQEKASDETQGRKWLDIDGNTNQLDTQSGAAASAQAQAGYTAEGEGNTR